MIKHSYASLQWLACLTVIFLSSAPVVTRAETQENKPVFQLPIDCTISVDCFVQSLSDMDPGPGVLDPFCGQNTYDGHKGTDIRVRTIEDLKKGVAVLAGSAGVVRGTRNDMKDRIIRTNDDRKRIEGRECGNGVVIDHGNGYESQYCHMLRGSVKVKKGQRVKAGQILGNVGVSGLTQFPHLHFTIRKDSQWLDAVTGLEPEGACSTQEITKSFFKAEDLKKFTDTSAKLLASGIAGQVIDHKSLVLKGGPAQAKQGDEATVGWVWFINLSKGDQIRITLNGPDGVIATNLTEPLDHHKASWSGFAGRKRTPKPGTYTLISEIVRDKKAIQTFTTKSEIR